MTTQIAEILKFAISSENPIVSVGVVLFAAFLMFVISRRFFTTDYIKENKESREQLKQLNEALLNECERLQKRNEELENELRLKNE